MSTPFLALQNSSMDDFKIENRLEKLRIFLYFCRSCASIGHLNLRNKELMHECIQVAEFYDGKCQPIIRYNRLGLENENTYQWEKAIDCYEKGLSIARQIGDTNNAIVICQNLGNVYQSLSEYEKAIKCHEKALEIAISIGDRKGVANSYTYLGITFKSKGKYNEAKDYHEKSLKIAKERNDEKGTQDAYGNLGDAYNSLGNTDEAIKCIESSLAIALAIGDKKGEGNAYGNLGIALHSLSRHKEAIRYLKKSLVIVIEIKDKEKQEILYGNLGAVYQSLNEYKKAIEYHEASKKIATEIGDKEGEATSYVNIGNSYQSMGKYKKAIRNFQLALVIAEDIGYKYGEETACFNLANSYHLMGKEKEALKYYECHLGKAKEIGNKEREATTYLNMGNVFQSLGVHKKALEYYEYSMRLAVEIGCKDIMGKSHGNMATVFEATGKYQQAIKCAEDCIKIAEEIGDNKGVSSAYASLATSLLNLGRSEEAIQYREKQLRIARDLGDKYGETNAYLGLGIANSSISEYKKAIEYYRTALNIAKETGDKRDQGDANTYIGISFLAQGYFYKEEKDQEKHYEYMNKSRSFLENSLQCWEWLYKHSVEKDKIKISFADTFHLSYRILTRVLIETGKHEEALLVSERGRARALNDLLKSRYGLPFINPSSTHSLQYSDVQELVSCASFCLVFYAHQDTSIAICLLSHQNPLIFVKDKIRGFKDKGHLKILGGKQGEISIGAYVSKALNAAYEKMKVREGACCEDRSCETSIQADYNDNVVENKSSALLYKRNDITEEINNNNEDQMRCIEEHEEQDEDCENPLEMLFEGLISPVQQYILHDEVVFAPEGPLNLIPFAALKDPSTGTYLSETKRIRLVPSLTTLKVLNECPPEHHKKTGALIIGNPEVGQVILRGRKTKFQHLPYAEKEAQMIGSLLGVEPFVGTQATKNVIMQRLREGVAVIHFAAHGTTDGEIALAPLTSIETSSNPGEEEYLLTMNDVQESGACPQLVVLSCCHSGRGEIKSEGVVGMSRAFLAAGARAVVASLWAIDDRATMFFMEKFYSHLSCGKSASRSLQQSMKEMREGPYSEPRYWAPFFLIGDDVTIGCFNKTNDERKN